MPTRSTLVTIADRAATVAKCYPECSVELARARRGLRYPCPDKRLEEHARHDYREQGQACDDWRREIQELAKLVIRHMPDMAPRLRHVARVVDRWHDRDDFDWQPVLTELKMIEVEALQRAESAGARANATDPTTAFVLDPDDKNILCALADAGTTMSLEKLEKAVELNCKTISRRLKRLRGLKLTNRPNGDKRGEAISDAGRALIAETSANVVAGR